MKKAILPCLLCVFFFLISTSVGSVFAFYPERMEFVYQNKSFAYNLEDNLKSSNVFDVDYEINKHHRFGSTDERIHLLKRMLKLGFDKAVALEYLFPNLSKTINSISKNIHISPQNAKITINKNSEQVFLISNEVVGVELDKATLINNICDTFINQKKMLFAIPTKQVYPQITKKHYQKFTNLRADFSTDISTSSSDRKHNIKNALMSLNKVEILPNQIFSFNDTVGRRTTENGYRQAKIIINNEFVDGIGGGVCQVSSTLYNTALLSGLEIIEANKHSRLVGYVKYGFDAMVNFGSSDLKFRNNTSEKLTIITNFTNHKARIRIFGEQMNNTHYKLKNEILNITKPVEEIVIDEKGKYLDKVMFDDEFFYLKKAYTGMEIKSYREKYINNTLVSTELLRHDKFKVQNAVKVYGSNKRISTPESMKKSGNEPDFLTFQQINKPKTKTLTLFRSLDVCY